MSKSQRTKGATYEREVAAHFSAWAGQKIARNITQARDGGHDLMVGSLVVECKRRKTLTTVEGWLQQAELAAFKMGIEDTVTGQVPRAIVVAREDAGKDLVVLRLSDFLKIVHPHMVGA